MPKIKKEKIAIAGFGIEGKALYKYFKDRKDLNIEIHIFDENKIKIPDKNVITHKSLRIPSEFKIIYKSPGIPTSKLKLNDPKKTEISSLTNLFLEKTKGRVIGVTGTKGKGTIATLINHILKKNGFKSVVVGNIGKPAINYLKKDDPDTYYIYEMSSFQCEHLKKSPHIAILNNLFPDHLNHHKNFNAYKKAKINITKFQNEDDFFINASDLKIKTKAKNISIKKLPFHFKTKLIGDYNQKNCFVAFKIAQILKIKDEDIIKAIETYEPLPMRLEKVAEIDGIIFYDDSLATIPEATLASIKALKDINTIILGGSDKGAPLENFAKQLAKTDIKNFIIFPDNGEKMTKYLNNPKFSKQTTKKIFKVAGMEKAVKIIYKNTKGICLLSNAAASLNLFKNYKDKSKQYRYWIKKLK